MKVIIIGSKGFIGQQLKDHFSQKGHEAWGADVIVDYVNTDRYFLIDASNSDYNSAFQNTQYDLCINCSGAASVPESLKNPVRDYYLNTVNVFKILEAIKNYQNKCRFINLSSAAIYGNPKNLPVKESAKPNPLSPYGMHKLQAEMICREFYDYWKIPTCSLRIFSVYGVGQQKQLFWDLYGKEKSGNPISLFGTGNESRDFINILDLVRAIEIVAENSGFRADVVNVSNGEEILIRDAVSVFFNCFDHPVTYTFSGNSRKGDPANWRADVRKLSSYGYTPSIDMKNGLKEYYDWIRA